MFQWPLGNSTGKFGFVYLIYEVFMSTNIQKDVYLWENQSLKVKTEQTIDALYINITMDSPKICDTISSGTGENPREYWIFNICI